jgi:hypothetical protein
MRLAIAFAMAAAASAQQHEIGLTLGGIVPSTRPTVRAGAGTALQADYAYRIAGNERAVALYANFHFLASPLREVASGNPGATRDFATAYLTPGIRAKFRSQARFTPFVEAGGGWAIHEHSRNRLDGRPNSAARLATTGTIVFGAGGDVKLTRWLGLRGEIRDYYSGSPLYNVASVVGRQNNLVVGGGFTLRFR